MTRPNLLPALLLAVVATACGQADGHEDLEALTTPDPRAVLGKSAAGVGGLQLSAATAVAGETLDVTVTADQGVLVTLGFPRELFAGPRYVRIPAKQKSATVTLHVNPYLAAPAVTTISARTSNPYPATFVTQAVSVEPGASQGEPTPRVASAVLVPSTVTSGEASALLITLSAPAPAAGAAVQVAISNDYFQLDASVSAVALVPPGATSVEVPVQSHLSSPTATTMDLYVVANLFGGAFQGGILTIDAR